MSELQNNAVALVTQTEGKLDNLSPKDRSATFLEKALSLYFAIGGNAADVQKLIEKRKSASPDRIENVIAGVLVELGAVSHLSDIDMVQATHNRFDAELKVRSPRTVR